MTSYKQHKETAFERIQLNSLAENKRVQTQLSWHMKRVNLLMDILCLDSDCALVNSL